MYFKKYVAKYAIIIFASSFLAVATTYAINTDHPLTLPQIIKVSNLYTLGSTGSLIQSVINLKNPT